MDAIGKLRPPALQQAMTYAPGKDQASWDRYIEFGGPLMHFTGLENNLPNPERVRNWIATVRASGGPTAVFMDTTTIHVAWQLLQGQWSHDPASLLDLSNVVSSVITSDTIFHIENPQLRSEGFNEFLHLTNDPVFIPCLISSAGPDVGSLPRGHWLQSVDYVQKLGSHPQLTEDAAEIKAAWQRLAGNEMNWERWSGKARDYTSDQGWEVSDPPYIYQLSQEFFKSGGRPYQTEFLDNFILDCNNRSLFNWGVVQALNLPYVPNIYRLPFRNFLLRNGYVKRQAFLKYFDSAIRKQAIETFSLRERLQLPSFISAIMARAKTLNEFREILAEYRLRAAPYRRKWAQLEAELRNDNINEARRLQKAITGEEIPKIWQWCASAAAVAAIAAATAAIETAHPGLLKALEIAADIAVAGAVGKGIDILAPGLFRPRMRLLSSVAEAARSVADAQDKVAQLWGVPSLGDQYAQSLNRVMSLDA